MGNHRLGIYNQDSNRRRPFYRFHMFHPGHPMSMKLQDATYNYNLGDILTNGIFKRNGENAKK